MSEFTAILIVNSGKGPSARQWLQLCLDKVREHTQDEPYRVYVWNNNTDDPWVGQFLASTPHATLLNQEPIQLVKDHSAPHALLQATCLQRLYEAARADGARYIVTLETDAHPIRSGWLKELKSALNGGAALAGVCTDELRRGIPPYIHASCLGTTVEFLEKNGLRPDSLPTKGKRRHDPMSCLTEKAQERGGYCHPMRRSNRNQLHGLMNGIYGDLVYHHGAGLRPRIGFWGRRGARERDEWNQRFRDETAAVLFRHPERFIQWLRGGRDFVFVLGMHRSGTSCLAGALERCGLFLGEVSRSNLHNARGNQELPGVIELHERILQANGGSWSSPPQKIDVSANDRQAMRKVVDRLSARAPCGLKEPRTLLFLPYWLELADSARLVGAFRHPAAVAQSLARRNQMSEAQAHDLWLHYNRPLIELHRQHAFPLLEFDLSDTDAFCETVAAVAVRLGLYPNLESLRQSVSQDLDHSDASDQAVPARCEDAYGYLREHRYRADPFEKALIELARHAPLQPERRGGIGGYLRRLGRRLAGKVSLKTGPHFG